jgi:rod shape-determining protein MreC
LLPANIIGASGFIPGTSSPEAIILDKGREDGLRVGNAVLYKNNLLGKISRITDSLSEVILVTNTSSSFTAKTSASGALGVIKGQGGKKMILDNVLLSDNLKSSDLVLTNGDTDLNGQGFPPGLVVGKIVAVDKKASSLSQRAEVESFIDFTNLTTVFVLVR